MAEKSKVKVMVNFRISFPKLFKPVAFGNGKPKYSMVMLIPKNDPQIKELKKLVADTAREFWPEENKRPKNVMNPIKDGDTDLMEDGTLRCEKYPEMAGHYVVSASTVDRPGVVDHDVQPILDETEIYSGCFCRTKVHAYAYGPSKTNPLIKSGVAIGFNNIQKVKDGEAFTGKSRPEDDFGPVSPAAKVAQDIGESDSDSMFG
jgi:hypothetical protein